MVKDFIQLTNARVASSNEHNLVREVTTLQDVKSSSISIIPFGFHHHILYCKCLPRVKICGPLVNVAENNRGNMMLRMRHYPRFAKCRISCEAKISLFVSSGRQTEVKPSVYLLNINYLPFVISFLLPTIR